MVTDFSRAKSFRRIALAAMAVLLLGFAACGGGDGGGGGTSAGSGTPWDPYLISTAQDLAALADRVNSGTEPDGQHYKLANNIDLSAYRTGTGWTPIGDWSHAFTGHFEGAGKTVYNLFIDNYDPPYAGLFGVIAGGTVENLGVEGAEVNSNFNYVGGIVGFLRDGSVNNCYVTGNIRGSSSVGGIAGMVQAFGANCGISNCYTTSNVRGYSRVGGIVGGVDETPGESGVVSNCYATGEISGMNSLTGGIVGFLGSGLVTQCAALNPKIIREFGVDTTFGRVVGSSFGGDMTRNVAFDRMTVGGDSTLIISADETSPNGASIIKATATSKTYYGSSPLSWIAAFPNNGNPWKWGGDIKPGYQLPVLYWQTAAQIPAAIPTHLQP
ncbi:MAG: hypothetical protein FWF95_01765 [Syntrophorhabdaceae bacterium]|nr:hypothetical protein [Syntrophorhabdaceae bacterium]